MTDFFNYVEKEAPKLIFNEKEYQISKKMIQIRLKANIAQDLWSSSDSYQVFNDFNEALQKAVQIYTTESYAGFNLDK